MTHTYRSDCTFLWSLYREKCYLLKQLRYSMLRVHLFLYDKQLTWIQAFMTSQMITSSLCNLSFFQKIGYKEVWTMEMISNGKKAMLTAILLHLQQQPTEDATPSLQRPPWCTRSGHRWIQMREKCHIVEVFTPRFDQCPLHVLVGSDRVLFLGSVLGVICAVVLMLSALTSDARRDPFDRAV